MDNAGSFGFNGGFGRGAGRSRETGANPVLAQATGIAVWKDQRALGAELAKLSVTVKTLEDKVEKLAEAVRELSVQAKRANPSPYKTPKQEAKVHFSDRERHTTLSTLNSAFSESPTNSWLTDSTGLSTLSPMSSHSSSSTRSSPPTIARQQWDWYSMLRKKGYFISRVNKPDSDEYIEQVFATEDEACRWYNLWKYLLSGEMKNLHPVRPLLDRDDFLSSNNTMPVVFETVSMANARLLLPGMNGDLVLKMASVSYRDNLSDWPTLAESF